MEISYPSAGILAVLAVLATCVLRTLHAPVIHTEDKLPDAPDGLMLLVADECLGAWGAEAMLAASRVFVQAGATLVLACREILVHSGECACARIGIAWRRKEGSIRPGLVTTTCTRYASSDKTDLVRNITKGVGGQPGSATLVHLDSSDSESRAAFSVRVCDVLWAANKNSKMRLVSGRMEC